MSSGINGIERQSCTEDGIEARWMEDFDRHWSGVFLLGPKTKSDVELLVAWLARVVIDWLHCVQMFNKLNDGVFLRFNKGEWCLWYFMIGFTIFNHHLVRLLIIFYPNVPHLNPIKSTPSKTKQTPPSDRRGTGQDQHCHGFVDLGPQQVLLDLRAALGTVRGSSRSRQIGRIFIEATHGETFWWFKTWWYLVWFQQEKQADGMGVHQIFKKEMMIQLRKFNGKRWLNQKAMGCFGYIIYIYIRAIDG